MDDDLPDLYLGGGALAGDNGFALCGPGPSDGVPAALPRCPIADRTRQWVRFGSRSFREYTNQQIGLSCAVERSVAAGLPREDHRHGVGGHGLRLRVLRRERVAVLKIGIAAFGSSGHEVSVCWRRATAPPTIKKTATIRADDRAITRGLRRGGAVRIWGGSVTLTSGRHAVPDRGYVDDRGIYRY